MDYNKKLDGLDLSAFVAPRTLRLRVIGKAESVHSIINKLIGTEGAIDNTLEESIGDLFGRKFDAIGPKDAIAAAKFGWQMHLAGDHLLGLELNFIALTLLMKKRAKLLANYKTTADLAAIVQIQKAAYTVMQEVSELMPSALGDHSVDDPLPSAVFRIILELNRLDNSIQDTARDRDDLTRFKEALEKLNGVWEDFTSDPVAYIMRFGATEEEAVPQIGIVAQHMGDTYMEARAWLEQTIEDGENFIAMAIRGELDASPAGRKRSQREIGLVRVHRLAGAMLECLAPFSAEELSRAIHGFVPDRTLAEEMIDAVLATDPAIQLAILVLLRSPAGRIFPEIMSIAYGMHGNFPSGSAAVALKESMEMMRAASSGANTAPATLFLQFIVDGKRKSFNVKGNGPALFSMLSMLQKQPVLDLDPGEGPKEYLERLLGPAVEVIEMD